MIDKNDLKDNLNMVYEWIRAADNKVSVLLVLEGIIITLLISDSVLSLIGDTRLSCEDIFFYIAGFVFLFMSAYKAILAIIPRLNRHKKEPSLLYFGDIANMNLKTFKDEVKKFSAKDYENQLIEQIHTASNIALTKHKHFRDSVLALSFSILLLTVLCISRLLYGY